MIRDCFDNRINAVGVGSRIHIERGERESTPWLSLDNHFSYTILIQLDPNDALELSRALRAEVERYYLSRRRWFIKRKERRHDKTKS